MRFFKPNPEYLKFVCLQDSHILNTKNTVGIAIRLNEMIYYLPVDVISKSDYDENQNLKKNTPTILRMIDVKTQEYLGKCLFSNMFPIPYKDLVPLNLDDFKESERKIAEKKLEYIKTHMNRIVTFSNRLYKQKIKGYNQRYLFATVDF